MEKHHLHHGQFGADEDDFYLCSEADSRISDLERQLAFANDAAAKGESARLTAAGMEARIEQLEKALKSCSLVIKQYVQHTEKHYVTAQEALIEADSALSL